MKNLPVLFLLVLLTACAPAVTEPPAPTETPVPTNTPAPTATIIPSPTPTATPVAIDGVADVDGVRYVFDDEEQEWMALPSLDAEHASMMVNADGAVVALDENGTALYELVLATGEWVKMEKVYTSCADPELIEQKVFAEFELATGYTPTEALQYLRDNKIFRPSYSYDPNNGTVTDDMMVLGSQFVSLEHLDGSDRGDGVVCVYGVYDEVNIARDGDSVKTEDVVALVVGFQYGGQYYPLANVYNDVDSGVGPTHFSVNTVREMQSWVDKYMRPGSLSQNNVHTFSGLKSVGDVEAEAMTFYPESMRVFVGLMDETYFERLSESGSPSVFSAWRVIRPDVGDHGLLARDLSLVWRGLPVRE